MIYDLSTPQKLVEAKEYLNGIHRLGKRVEIKQLSGQRTLNQNSFFWLLVSFFGNEIGLTKEESKVYVQRHMKDIFAYEKNGNYYLRGTSELTTKEMSVVMERLYLLAGDMGISLPLVENDETVNLMEKELEKSRF
jgi:hypothetical protein